MMNTIGNVWRKTFDHVYCVSYAPYKERRKKLFEELERVEVIAPSLDPSDHEPFFSIHYTVENPFEQLLLGHPDFKWPEHNKRFNKGALSLSLGHYAVMKEAIALGYLRILIIEDDVAFLKDYNKIIEILENIPLSADVIMYDKVAANRIAWEEDVKHHKSVDGNYVMLSPQDILWTTSCFSLTPTAMWHIIKCQEKSFNVADYYTNAFAPTEDHSMFLMNPKMTRYSSIIGLACQRPSDETISDHGDTNSVYNQRGLYDCGINLEDYNL